MEQWMVVSLLLCTFGLLRELRPSEPYVSEFLLGPWRNITEETLNQHVYPVGTYSYLALLIVVFLITDYLKYKPLIIVSGLSGIGVYSILLWTKSLEWLQASQFLYGLYMATEVAYYTYMFAKVDEKNYDKVASYTRSSALVGRFISGLSAQLLTSFKALDYRQLNYITFSSQILATIWAVFLPSVDRSIYFHREVNTSTESKIDQETTSNNPVPINGVQLLWQHAKSAYSRKSVIAWSAWYAGSTAGFYQVQTYIQLLWIDVEPEQENIYNGVVEAILTVLGACGALLGGLKRFENKNVYNILPAFAAAIQAGAVLAACFAPAVWLSYVGYIFLGIIYHYMITIASSQIAHNLVYDSCFGLIFGINTLIALIIQSLLTLIIISDHGLALDIRSQYRAYAVYYVILSIIGITSWFITCYLERKTTPEEDQNIQDVSQ
ncbi:thiamine transporter 1-like [Arctopsyche grandis]|uniref:thiamine transporter 1-like n=1 Tax=Arctopsyche grandis TaxID=121162 RepID=UPI00406D9F7B